MQMMLEWRGYREDPRARGELMDAEDPPLLRLRLCHCPFIAAEEEGCAGRTVRRFHFDPALGACRVERQDIEPGSIAILIGNPSHPGGQIAPAALVESSPLDIEHELLPGAPELAIPIVPLYRIEAANQAIECGNGLDEARWGRNDKKGIRSKCFDSGLLRNMFEDLPMCGKITFDRAEYRVLIVPLRDVAWDPRESELVQNGRNILMLELHGLVGPADPLHDAFRMMRLLVRLPAQFTAQHLEVVRDDDVEFVIAPRSAEFVWISQ